MADENDNKGPQDQESAGGQAPPASRGATQPPAAGDRAPKRQRRVEVLVDNLGPNLLRKGQITDDPVAVALLDQPHGHALVREVKGESKQDGK